LSSTQIDAQKAENNIDDYFTDFSEYQCCEALTAHHAEYCEESRLLTNFHLFLAAAVLLMCEAAKAIFHRMRLHFFPEAAVCILVGTLCGAIAHFVPFIDSIDDLSFDNELFLTVLLPPIIFDAALSVSKKEFKRRRGAIFLFSVFGTVITTFSTGLMVHYGSRLFGQSQTFPMLDSLVYGALISSIDPVAILSVLTSLKLDQKDTIYILVFGESLLNDGIAITLFQTLVHRFDGKTNDGSTSVDEVLGALVAFFFSVTGSIAVGIVCGFLALKYYVWLGNYLPPVMEVGSFVMWALVPYYISDGIGWSGIVSIVAVGFFMDIYIAGPKQRTQDNGIQQVTSSGTVRRRPPPLITTNLSVDRPPLISTMRSTSSLQQPSQDTQESAAIPSSMSMEEFEAGGSMMPLPSTERIHLSATANRHVRFVAHLTSQLSENAIFAYLGLFLLSQNYIWEPTMVVISILACVLSRTLMIVVVSAVILRIYQCRGLYFRNESRTNRNSRTAAAIQDPRTQAVLVLAGLRGAVSLALVENVPLYNNVTGEGCEFKPLMKGMVSASILFTTLVFGSGAYFVLPWLGIGPEDTGPKENLIHSDHQQHEPTMKRELI